MILQYNPYLQNIANACFFVILYLSINNPNFRIKNFFLRSPGFERLCMNKKQSFFGNAFFYTLGVVLAQGTSFITMTILNHMMPPEQYAYISTYAIWASIFGTIAGITAYGSLNNAKLDFGPNKLNAYTSVTFGMGTLSLGILFVIVFLIQGLLTSITGFPTYVLFLALLQGFFSFAFTHLANKYRVLNQPRQFVLWSSLVFLLRLAISVTLVYFFVDNKYLGDVYGSSVAYAAVGIAASVVILARGKTFFHAEWWKYCFLISMPIVFHGLANLILGQADQIMLKALSTEHETGVYGYVYIIGMASTAVWSAFNNAWSVWYFDKTHAGQKEQIVALFKKYGLFVTFLSVGFILVSPDLVRILAAPEYQSGIYMIPLIAAGCYFQFLYTFPVAYESYKQKTLYIAIGTVAAAALNIGLNYYMIPLYGGMAAAFDTLVSYLMLFLFHYIIAKYIIKGFELKFVHLLVPALYVAAATSLAYLCIDLWPVRWLICLMLLGFSFRTYLQSRHIMME